MDYMDRVLKAMADALRGASPFDGRCTGTTKKGLRCKNRALDGEDTCAIHYEV